MSTANELACDNCGVPHGVDDIFCENCGYDFITGSLPGPSEEFKPPPSSTPASPEAPSPPVAPGADPAAPPAALRVQVGPDRPYFDTVVAEGELAYPEPPPPSQVLELTGHEHHIGRTSRSKAIHPDLDIAALTADPAVSSRHAVMRVDPSGAITVTDIGSTNGTYVGSADGSPITPGEPVLVAAGTPIYVGAWTRIVVAAPDAGGQPLSELSATMASMSEPGISEA